MGNIDRFTASDPGYPSNPPQFDKRRVRQEAEMRAISRFRVLFGASLFLLAVVLFPSSLTANHSWGKYHWARSSNPLSLDIGDNVSSIWGGHLDTAVGDWNLSSVLDLTVVRGGSDPSSCPPTSGRVEV